MPEKSAAAAAGLRATRRGLGGIVAGDLIIMADGRRVATEGDLVAAVEAHQVGEAIELVVRRGEGGGEKDVEEVKMSVVLEAAAAARCVRRLRRSWGVRSWAAWMTTGGTLPPSRRVVRVDRRVLFVVIYF